MMHSRSKSTPRILPSQLRVRPEVKAQRNPKLNLNLNANLNNRSKEPPRIHLDAVTLDRRSHKRWCGRLARSRLALSPSVYTTLKYSVLPTLKLSNQVQDPETKELLYRNLLRNYPLDMDSEGYTTKMKLFSERFTALCQRLPSYAGLTTSTSPLTKYSRCAYT